MHQADACCTKSSTVYDVLKPYGIDTGEHNVRLLVSVARRSSNSGTPVGMPLATAMHADRMPLCVKRCSGSCFQAYEVASGRWGFTGGS